MAAGHAATLGSTWDYAKKGAAIGTVIPGLGTLAGLGIGAAAGAIKGLLSKKPYTVEEHTKASQSGGYITIPPTGLPDHPEWKPGTRQWIPPGSPGPGQSGTGVPGQSANGSPITGSLGVNENAIRERAIAPTRGLFEAGKRNVERNKALQGGYAPGYGAQMLALARGQSQAGADASLSAENEINQQNTRRGRAKRQD